MDAPPFITRSPRASFIEIIKHWWPETGWREHVLQGAVVNLVIRCAGLRGGVCCGQHVNSVTFGGPVLACFYRQAMHQIFQDKTDEEILAESGCDPAGLEQLAAALALAPPTWLAAWKARLLSTEPGLPPDTAEHHPTPPSPNKAAGGRASDDVLACMLEKYPGGSGHPKGWKGFCEEFRKRTEDRDKLGNDGIRSRIRRRRERGQILEK
jgi:hypothetical protein